MSLAARLRTAWDALRQLGFEPVALAGLYRFGLLTGHYRRATPVKTWEDFKATERNLPLNLPAIPAAEHLRLVMDNHLAELIREADEIRALQVRLFGAHPVPLHFSPALHLAHWSAYETGKAPWGAEDVKFIWEPARLGWAVTLARAYAATHQPEYAADGLRLLNDFLIANPPNAGPNWASAQEVGLRITALAKVASVLKVAEISQSNPSLQTAIIAHAERIPPTLVYARAQNNNHLLSEAVGLYTAGVVLPTHPKSADWRALGWKWANHCFQTQIAPDGTYNQQSANYHRMLLQLALWFKRMADLQGESLPPQSAENLSHATQWLLARLDPLTGKVPNLGHNDGGYILPLASGGFADYRPVAQAASRAFLNAPWLPPGAWDEMSLWFELSTQPASLTLLVNLDHHGILSSDQSWASLRAARYATRPGQADQLHVDIFWRGEPVTLDAGTFQYNAAPPWENALASTLVHNTITVNEQDQMRRAGRFLWLDWAQSTYVPPVLAEGIMASHDGYLRRFRLNHAREIYCTSPDIWEIKDWLNSNRHDPPLTITLHWLLPDLPHILEGNLLRLTAPHGEIRINVESSAGNPSIQLIRAGQVLFGDPVASPILGWFSPTYGVKVPALSLRVQARAVAPLEFTTHIELIPSDNV